MTGPLLAENDTVANVLQSGSFVFKVYKRLYTVVIKCGLRTQTGY